MWLGPRRMEPLFESDALSAHECETLDRDGYVVLPGRIAPEARRRLARSIARVEALRPDAPKETRPRRYAAEHDRFLGRLVAHPQLVALARAALGPEIRFDHCVCLGRPPGHAGMRWHSHGYAEGDPRLGLLRIFLYASGFGPGDGGLKAVPGSHRLREAHVHAESDGALRRDWLAAKRDPASGTPLAIEALSAPPGSVVAMWTHTVHGVEPRRSESGPRLAVVFGYRNPGAASPSRWITPEFERRAQAAGGEALAALVAP